MPKYGVPPKQTKKTIYKEKNESIKIVKKVSQVTRKSID